MKTKLVFATYSRIPKGGDRSKQVTSDQRDTKPQMEGQNIEDPQLNGTNWGKKCDLSAEICIPFKMDAISKTFEESIHVLFHFPVYDHVRINIVRHCNNVIVFCNLFVWKSLRLFCCKFELSDDTYYGKRHFCWLLSIQNSNIVGFRYNSFHHIAIEH